VKKAKTVRLVLPLILLEGKDFVTSDFLAGFLSAAPAFDCISALPGSFEPVFVLDNMAGR
jgi:hypothetical protein